MTKVTIKYNTPVIVNKYVYSIIMSQLAGACAGKDDTYEIKLLDPRYKKVIQSIIDRFN